MRAGGASAPFAVKCWRAVGCGLAFAGALSTGAHAAAGGPWDAVSGAFVGPDGVRLAPTIVAGVVGALLLVTIVARLARKPEAASAAAAAAQKPAAEKIIAQKPVALAPVVPASAAKTAAAPARAPVQPVAAAVRPAPFTQEQAPAKPAPQPAAATRPSKRFETVLSAKPAIRKLSLELDLKHRSLAFKPGAPGPVVKLPTERRGVIAHVQKAKLIDELESAKRRPGAVSIGRRSASLRTSSS